MDGYVGAELIDLALEGLRELGVFDEKVTVERTGYPDHLYRRTFRAVRDGKIIAIIGVYEYPPKPDVSSGSPTNTENATAPTPRHTPGSGGRVSGCRGRIRSRTAARGRFR